MLMVSALSAGAVITGVGVTSAVAKTARHASARADTGAPTAAKFVANDKPGKGNQGGGPGAGNAGSGSASGSSGPPPGHANSNGGGGASGGPGNSGHGNSNGGGHGSGGHGNSGHGSGGHGSGGHGLGGHGNSGHGNSGHGNSGHGSGAVAGPHDHGHGHGHGHGSSNHGGAAAGSGGAGNGHHGRGHGAAGGAGNGHHGRGHGAAGGAGNGHHGRGHGAAGGAVAAPGGGCTKHCHGTKHSALVAAPAVAVTPAPAPAAAPVARVPATARRDSSTSRVASPRARRPATDSSTRAGLLAAIGTGTGAGTGTVTGTVGAAISGLSAGGAGLLVSPFHPGLQTTPAALTGTPLDGSTGATVGTTPLRSRLPTSTSTQPSEFQRIVRVVPDAVWLALAGALLLAAVAAGAAVWSGARVRRQAGRFAEMSLAAVTDPLTGVLNRRGFTEAANRELERARRYGRPLALAYVDVRGLKTVNDSEGHGAGDKLLRATARLLTDSARENDVVGRLGGDEMGLLLVEQTPEGAQAATQRIETEVLERRPGIGLQSPWDLTVGTSTFPADGETVDELLRAADLRLYEQRGIELL